MSGEASVVSTGRLRQVIDLIKDYLLRDAAAAASAEVAEVIDALEAAYSPGTHDGDPLDLLAQTCGLDEPACALLMIAAAPEIDARFAGLYSLLDRVETRVRPSVGLALDLVGAESYAAQSGRLHGATPLRRHNLVDVVGGEVAQLRTLVVSEQVVSHLLGHADAGFALEHLALQVPSRHDDVATQLARGMRVGVRIGLLHSPTGSAGVATAFGAFEQLNLPVVGIDAGRRPSSTSLSEMVNAAVLEATLRGAGLILHRLQSADSDGREVIAAIEQAAVPVIVVDELPWRSEHLNEPHIRMVATRLSRAERAALWGRCLDSTTLTGSDRTSWDDLLGLHLAPEDIFQAVRAASVATAIADRPIRVDDLRDAAREQSAARLAASAACITPQVQLSDVVLPEPAQRSLRELVGWARARSVLHEGTQLRGKGTKGTGVTALFAGGPGTGKTLAAEAVAGELGVDLMTVDLSELMDKYIGETEKRLEALITEAENSNVVLFFDEADATFGARSAVESSNDRYANQGVSFLLQRIERFEGVAILATNLKGNLDKAFIRRIQHVITFPDPDADTRARLWAAHLAAVNECDPDDPIDVPTLAATVDVAGANIRNIVQAASFIALSEHASALGSPVVGMRHIIDATEREYSKLGRRSPALAGAARSR